MNINPTAASNSLPGLADTAAASRPAAAPAKAVSATGAPSAVDKATSSAAPATPVDPADLKNSVEAINRFLRVNSEVQFSIDDASGRSVIKVIDTESKKILRQFPSEQVMQMSKDLGKDLNGLKGFLVNNKA